MILWGALSDGTLGLHAIKHAGGLALVQHPEEASFLSQARVAKELHQAAGTDRGGLETERRGGFAEHLGKPFDPERLIETIERLGAPTGG